jgi:translation initiation factor IF-2
MSSSIATGILHPHVIGFNAAVDPLAYTLAHQHGVRIETFDIIYKMTERVEELMRAAAPKRTIETTLGRARILKLFSEKHSVHLVGASVTDGVIMRGGTVRFMRKGESVGEGTVLNMQANRQNVSKVEAGAEFGLEVETEAELAAGDVAECIQRSIA